MIAEKKFFKLKPVTRDFKIAGELRAIRNSVLQGCKPDTAILEKYTEYVKNMENYPYLEDLILLLKEKDHRKIIEISHFLYHRIKNDHGYPVSENEFIKTSRDIDKSVFQRSELIVLLENLRSAFNTGSIIRSSECFGIKKLILTGITPGPEHPGVIKTSKGTLAGVKIEKTDSPENVISGLKNDGYSIIAAETGENASDISVYEFPKKSVLVFGNEEIGISSETLELCDEFVMIGMKGKKNSLNVSNAAAVFIHSYVLKHPNLSSGTVPAGQ